MFVVYKSVFKLSVKVWIMCDDLRKVRIAGQERDSERMRLSISEIVATPSARLPSFHIDYFVFHITSHNTKHVWKPCTGNLQVPIKHKLHSLNASGPVVCHVCSRECHY